MVIIKFLNGNFFILNIVVTAFALFALYNFIFSLKEPFLANFIAFPFLIVVAFMGYTKQALAFSFFLLALSYLLKSRTNIYILLVIIGSLFHISVILMLIFVLPFIITSYNRFFIFS